MTSISYLPWQPLLMTSLSRDPWGAQSLQLFTYCPSQEDRNSHGLLRQLRIVNQKVCLKKMAGIVFVLIGFGFFLKGIVGLRKVPRHELGFEYVSNFFPLLSLQVWIFSHDETCSQISLLGHALEASPTLYSTPPPSPRQDKLFIWIVTFQDILII